MIFSITFLLVFDIFLTNYVKNLRNFCFINETSIDNLLNNLKKSINLCSVDNSSLVVLKKKILC